MEVALCSGELYAVLAGVVRGNAGTTCGKSGPSDLVSPSSPSAENSDSDSEYDRAVRAAVSGKACLGGVQGLAWVDTMELNWGWVVCLDCATLPD